MFILKGIKEKKEIMILRKLLPHKLIIKYTLTEQIPS